MHKTKLQTRQT